MSNPYYTESGAPELLNRGASSAIRNEFITIRQGFDTVSAAFSPATSASNISNAVGPHTFVTQAGKAFAAGQFVTITSTAGSGDYMQAQVTSYSGTSLVVNALTVTGGAGPFASWNITLSVGSLTPVVDQSGGIPGLTAYKVNFKNNAGTQVSYLTNNNTVSRTYTFPDADITVATSGANTFTGAQNEAQGADIASASTINLDAATGNLVDVTGSVTITAITLAQGAGRVVRFTGAPTLTNGVSLVLPGGANIVAAPGDFATFRGYAAGVVRCTDYSVSRGVVSANDLYEACCGRLTLTGGLPVTTADVTAATVLYFTPHKGNKIGLYANNIWSVLAFTEKSLAVPATTATNYDVFAYNNAGVVTLESLAWTNSTTRATALVMQDGILVKSGDATRRYLGSFRTAGAAGQTEDSYSKRLVWNYYNRVARQCKNITETVDSWVYSTALFRQANANSGNQLEFIIGVVEDTVEANCAARVTNGTNQGVVAVGIGLDSTTVNSAQIMATPNIPANGITTTASAYYKGYPVAGWHYLAWLEYAEAVGVTTWYGDAGIPAYAQSGIIGTVLG